MQNERKLSKSMPCVISIHGKLIANHDDVQQSAVNVNVQSIHAVGDAMASFLKRIDEKEISCTA